MAVNEDRVTKATIKRLERLPNIFFFKVHGGAMQKRGIPDILGCWRGYFFAIEMKAPGKSKSVTTLQQKRMRDIRRGGGIAFVADNPRYALIRLVGEVRRKNGDGK